MIFGFADLVTLSPLTFCRPEVTADGPLSIRGGRHPIVGAVQEDCKFVPNDTYMRRGGTTADDRQCSAFLCGLFRVRVNMSKISAYDTQN